LMGAVHLLESAGDAEALREPRPTATVGASGGRDQTAEER
jgi:hypothetical protein